MVSIDCCSNVVTGFANNYFLTFKEIRILPISCQPISIHQKHIVPITVVTIHITTTQNRPPRNNGFIGKLLHINFVISSLDALTNMTHLAQRNTDSLKSGYDRGHRGIYNDGDKIILILEITGLTN